MTDITAFRRRGRRAVRPGDSLVAMKPMTEEQALPQLAEPTIPDVDLAVWIAGNLPMILSELHRAGGILFRGFGIDSAEAFERVAKAFGHELLPYAERTSPRIELRPHVYTSTEHPNDQYIQFHNANSYSHQWPGLIWFGCLVAAETGGHTPLVDCRRVYELIDPEVRDEFARRGVMYLRNFRENVGLPWQVTFQTEDPSEVRRYSTEAGITIDLFEGDRLRTRQVRQAVAHHPVTREILWFNQAHLFHVSGLQSSVTKALLQGYDEQDLPRNAYYGDGGTIDPAVLRHIVECYQSVQVSEPWQVGDFLILDNMLAAHARTPYTGDRVTVVSFADLTTSTPATER